MKKDEQMFQASVCNGAFGARPFRGAPNAPCTRVQNSRIGGTHKEAGDEGSEAGGPGWQGVGTFGIMRRGQRTATVLIRTVDW